MLPEQRPASRTWGSALTADEFAAVRSAGFEPVGQVFGAAVYDAGSASGYSCPAAWGPPGDAWPGRAATQVSGRGDPGSFCPLVQAMYQARRTAIDRMTTECAGLGGHGVVGVRLSLGSFPLGGLEFKAIGTAVRAPGAPPGPRVPFTCDLSGQDFAKLIVTGWVPAGLALGISIGSRHDDRKTARQTRWKGRQHRGRRLDRARRPVTARRQAPAGKRRKAARRRGRGNRRHGNAGARTRLPGPGRPPRPHRGGDPHRHRHRQVLPSRATSRRGRAGPGTPGRHVARPAAAPGRQSRLAGQGADRDPPRPAPPPARRVSPLPFNRGP